MAIFKVPGNLTLHAAVAAAAASHDAENVIDIGPAVVHLNTAIELDNAFNSSRKLTIRRDPALPPPRRGTIISSNPGTMILAAGGAAYVRLQDLDFLRNVTNNQDLVVLSNCADFIVERCRIGSIWTTPGSEGWSNLRISSPTNVIVRNTILFALHRNTFDYGARIQFGTGFGHSLLLYNNVVADHEEYGIHATGPAGDAILLLRNNVVINHQDANPEPVACYSGVDAHMTVVTSHNVVFAGVGQVETIVFGAQSVSGEAAASFLRFARAQAAGSFVERAWDRNPIENPNVNLFRLQNGGPLHNGPGDAGQTVGDHVPHVRDVKVADDIEKDARPGGIPLHTDRGADQIRTDDLLVNLGSLTLTPPVVAGCRPCQGRITLTVAAPGAGADIALTTEGPAAAPGKVTVPAGSTGQNFQVDTTAVSAVTPAKITATYRGVSRTESLTVRPVGVQSLKLADIAGGSEGTGTVVLECKAQPSDIRVTLTSGNPAVLVPASLVIANGAVSAPFPIRTTHVSAPTPVTITATANGMGNSATLIVKP